MPGTAPGDKAGSVCLTLAQMKPAPPAAILGREGAVWAEAPWDCPLCPQAPGSCHPAPHVIGGGGGGGGCGRTPPTFTAQLPSAGEAGRPPHPTGTSAADSPTKGGDPLLPPLGLNLFPDTSRGSAPEWGATRVSLCPRPRGRWCRCRAGVPSLPANWRGGVPWCPLSTLASVTHRSPRARRGPRSQAQLPAPLSRHLSGCAPSLTEVPSVSRCSVGAVPRGRRRGRCPRRAGGSRRCSPSFLPRWPPPVLVLTSWGEKGGLRPTPGSCPAPISAGAVRPARQGAPRGQRPGARRAVVQGLCTPLQPAAGSADLAPAPARRGGRACSSAGSLCPCARRRRASKRASAAGRPGWGSWRGGRGESREALSQHGVHCQMPEPRTKTHTPVQGAPAGTPSLT